MRKGVFFGYLVRRHWQPLTAAFIAVILEGLADLAQPWPIKVVLDYCIGSKHAPQWLDQSIQHTFGRTKQGMLGLAVAIVLVSALVGAVASYAGDYLTTKVGQSVMRDLRLSLYHHLQRLSLSFFHRNRVGDLIGRVTGDVDSIQNFVST
ncbi:MAG TPA: ABC transporter transmembrane domain-containing protein, partial [Blastocatellia bacterium]|nr:ABC transporter transmembrane domain-containing protein [Blastocatellia bacterium]